MSWNHAALLKLGADLPVIDREIFDPAQPELKFRFVCRPFRLMDDFGYSSLEQALVTEFCPKIDRNGALLVSKQGGVVYAGKPIITATMEEGTMPPTVGPDVCRFAAVVLYAWAGDSPGYDVPRPPAEALFQLMLNDAIFPQILELIGDIRNGTETRGGDANDPLPPASSGPDGATLSLSIEDSLPST